MINAAVITVSSSREKNSDTSGKKVIEILKRNGFEICGYTVVRDDIDQIKEEIKNYAASGAEVVFTTGGTGLGPYDVTPEATRQLSDREIPGISQLMRGEGLKKTKRAALSRGISVLRGNTIIINLPGSPAGAGESLSAVIDIIPHAVDVVKGGGH